MCRVSLTADKAENKDVQMAADSSSEQSAFLSCRHVYFVSLSHLCSRLDVLETVYRNAWYPLFILGTTHEI